MVLPTSAGLSSHDYLPAFFYILCYWINGIRIFIMALRRPLTQFSIYRPRIIISISPQKHLNSPESSHLVLVWNRRTISSSENRIHLETRKETAPLARSLGLTAQLHLSLLFSANLVQLYLLPVQCHLKSRKHKKKLYPSNSVGLTVGEY